MFDFIKKHFQKDLITKKISKDKESSLELDPLGGFLVNDNALSETKNKLTFARQNYNTLLIDSSFSTRDYSLVAQNIDVFSKATTKHNCIVLTDNDKIINQTKDTLSQNGYNTLIFDFTSPDKSHKFNPLKEMYRDYSNNIKSKMAKNDAVIAIEPQLRDFVNAILNNASTPLYQLQKDLFVSFLLAMIEDEKYSLGTYNLENFYYEFCKFNPKDKDVFEKLDKHFENKCDYTKTLYSNFSSLNKVTKEAVYKDLAKNLEFLKDKAIHRFLAKNHFDIKSFVNTPTAIFIKHYNMENYFNKFTNILLEYIMKQYIDELNTNESLKVRPTNIFVENIFTARKLNILPYLMLIARSKNMSCMLRAENIGELKAMYPVECEAMLDSCPYKVILTKDQKTMESLVYSLPAYKTASDKQKAVIDNSKLLVAKSKIYTLD